MVLKTRNMSSDVVKMYEVLTDLFPGIEQCIHNNLTVRDECTKRGTVKIWSGQTDSHFF